jgi:hypothetical protein
MAKANGAAALLACMKADAKVGDRAWHAIALNTVIRSLEKRA